MIPRWMVGGQEKANTIIAIAIAIQSTRPVQPLQLGLFRSDYLLHSSSSDASSPLELKQVEFNTISSSFGALSQLAGDLHR